MTPRPAPARRAIPESPEALTPAWLTRVLRERGGIAEATITAIASEPIGMIGWSTHLARLRLAYDRVILGVPTTLIAKFSARDSHTRRFFGRFYEREVFFYRTLASRASVRTPRCYHADYDPLTQAHLLLLEDMAPAVAGDLCRGVGAEVALDYARQIARLHAQWWEVPELDALLQRYPSPGATFARRYSERLAQGIDVMRPYLDRTVCRLAERLQHSLHDRWTRQSLSPLTLIHWDAHAANTMLPSTGGGTLTILDWQNWTAGRGIWDVARYCILSLPIAERRAAEPAIIELYTKTLEQLGVPAYPTEQAIADYRDAMPLQFAQQLRFFASIQHWDDERRAWIAAITPRVAAALEDAAAARILD